MLSLFIALEHAIQSLSDRTMKQIIVLTSLSCFPVKVHGGWSVWDQWTTPCSYSHPCEIGYISRNRTCTEPVPLHNGDPCLGDGYAEKACIIDYGTQCPIAVFIGGSNSGVEYRDDVYAYDISGEFTNIKVMLFFQRLINLFNYV